MAVYTLHSEGNHSNVMCYVRIGTAVYTLNLRYLPSGLRPQLNAQQRAHNVFITIF